MMQKVADYGMWAFALCVVLEIVKIPINLMNGFPPFFEFLNLKYSLSPDNSLFILYWGGLIGIIANLLTEHLERDKGSKETNKVVKTDHRTYEKRDQYAYLNTIETTNNKGWRDMSWVDPKTNAVKNYEDYRSGYVPHMSWYERHDISSNDVKMYLSLKDKNFDYVFPNPTRFVLEFKKWKKEYDTKNKSQNQFKDVTRTPRSKVHLTMFDFFNHHRYKEFEVSESIDLKTSNLEVIEIYKLFKAYLLLKYNIEVIDTNE